ncbi:MAG: phosphodiester glycosidase family protein [Dysgonamonadaceae bacterium]|jgi:hypothetical protein|nr:phosphodiester glycosidase family protein [Dysgonamonadaceae bacterium]
MKLFLKTLFTSLIVVFSAALTVLAQSQSITIGGNTYNIQVSESRQLTPEAVYTAYNISGFPLKIFAVKIDCRAQNLQVQAWSGADYTLNTKETPLSVANRKNTETFQVLSAINGDFFGSAPCGAEIIKGEMSQNIVSTEFFIGGVDFTPYAGIDYEGKPIVDVFRFTPYVKKLNANGDSLFLKKTINSGIRNTDEFILFNNYLGYSETQTNEWGHECLISPVSGNWTPDANGYIRCKIEKLRKVTETQKMEILPGKAVLSGHGTSRTFLADLQVGDEVLVSWGAKLVYHPEIRGIREAVAGGTMCLRNGVVQEYTVTDAAREKDRHPRTSFGVSEDRNYMWFVVIDGRDTGISIGVSTKEEADIMKFLGAHDAVNLDGGGSSCMVVNGAVKNKPSDGSPRLVINGLLLAKTLEENALPAYENPVTAVYPNPAGGQVNFRVTADRDYNDLQITVYSTGGEAVKQVCSGVSLIKGETRTFTCNTGNLADGVYVYTMTGAGNRFAGKLILKRE